MSVSNDCLGDLPSGEGVPQRPGVGLRNTEERLANLYGEDYALDMYPSGEGGFTVDLELPLAAAGARQRLALG